MADLSVLKNIVRTGRVSSVNAGNRTARVTFEDKGQSPLVSGELKVIKNPPFIPAKGAAQRTEAESGGSGEAAFARPFARRQNSPVVAVAGRLCFMPVYPDGRRRRVRDWRDINNGAYRELG